MPFRYIGLEPESFLPLTRLDDAQLATRGMRRLVADVKPGFPCRVSLEDAEPGERILLLAFEHQPADTPFRAAGPIFIRERAEIRCDVVGEPPQSLLLRPLSLRAYGTDGMMLDAALAHGDMLEASLGRLFANPDVAYVHIHYATRGCYAARVERA